MTFNLSPLGIGTYGVGGRGHRNVALTEREDGDVYTRALVHALDIGMNFSEVSCGYGHGNALTLLARSVVEAGVPRERLFLTSSFYPVDLDTLDAAESDLSDFLSEFGGYADSILVTQSLVLRFGEVAVYSWLEQILQRGLAHYVSISNAGLLGLLRFSEVFGDRVWAHETHLSFPVRVVDDAGLLEKATELGLRNVIWRPLRRRGGVVEDPVVLALAEQYDLGSSGVLLNWMVWRGLYPLVFSTNPDHISANLAAVTLQFGEEEYAALDAYRDLRYLVSLHWDEELLDEELVALATD